MSPVYIIDRTYETTIAGLIIDAIEEAGYTPEEGLGGLLRATFQLADLTGDPEGSLDEFGNRLADGPDAEEDE